MPALVAGIHVFLCGLSHDRVVQVIPTGIAFADRSDLPRTWPVLDRVLALDRGADVLVVLEMNEPLQAIPLGEAIDGTRAMLEYPPDKIVGHPDIENAVGTIGQDVNIASPHADMMKDVDGRDKPGHDAEWEDAPRVLTAVMTLNGTKRLRHPPPSCPHSLRASTSLQQFGEGRRGCPPQNFGNGNPKKFGCARRCLRFFFAGCDLAAGLGSAFGCGAAESAVVVSAAPLDSAGCGSAVSA